MLTKLRDGIEKVFRRLRRKELVRRDAHGVIAIPNEAAATDVYHEVCTCDTYELQRIREPIRVAVDLGASWGVATRMMRSRWPQARIVAFEPDPSRFSYLARNCPAVDCRRDAVVGFADDPVRRVRGVGFCAPWRATPEEVFTEAILQNPISAHKALAGIEFIDLLKIDVEGFELGIFQEMDEMGLLARTRRIVGEWHFPNVREGISGVLARTHHLVFGAGAEAPWGPFTATLK